MRVMDNATAIMPTEQKAQCALQKQNLAICFTLYNESADLMRPSLESVINSLDALSRYDAAYRKATVCIIADGVSHISESVRLYLDSLALEPRGSLEGEARTALSARTFHAEQLAEISGRQAPSQMEITLKLVSKAQNSGKLDSHRIFYDRICPGLNPDYCFQIDAGTLLERKAFTGMCALFEADKDTAGLASNVLIAPPGDGNIIQSFQCGDFAVQKTIRWPSEVFSGYLSVLPGQFSAIRWSSFNRTEPGGGMSPKQRYLRGQNCRSAAESMMYLSEDRVLGFELATQRGQNNRLDYAPQAVCHTDACHTIAELLLQRRRWLNGSLFCRSWMIGRILGMFVDPHCSVRQKTRFVPALFNLSAQHLLEWFLPLLNILLLAMTWISLNHVISPQLAPVIFALLATIWLLPSVLALTGHLQKWPASRVQGLLRMVSMVFFSIIGINIANLAQQPGMTAYLYYLSMPMALAGGAFAGALILNRAIIPHLKSSVLTFISLAPSMWLMMSAYAFFNLHDGSWGTKGLSRKAPADRDGKNQDLSAQFHSLRKSLLMAWIVSNCGLSIYILYAGHISAALMVAGSLQIMLITTGLFGAISTRVAQSSTAPRMQRASAAYSNGTSTPSALLENTGSRGV